MTKAHNKNIQIYTNIKTNNIKLYVWFYLFSL